MSEFIFTPGQRDEALAWLKENCPNIDPGITTPDNIYMEDLLIDMYFKLKQIDFKLKPTEFIVGVEYKNQDAVIAGTEKINLTMQNCHKKGQYDEFTYQVLAHFLNSLKG